MLASVYRVDSQELIDLAYFQAMRFEYILVQVDSMLLGPLEETPNARVHILLLIQARRFVIGMWTSSNARTACYTIESATSNDVHRYLAPKYTKAKEDNCRHIRRVTHSRTTLVVVLRSSQRNNSYHSTSPGYTYKIDKMVRRRNLNFRLRNISILFLSMSQPELVKIAMENFGPKCFQRIFPRQNNHIGDFQGTKFVFWNVETEFTMSVSPGDMEIHPRICYQRIQFNLQSTPG
jgi:hypothetical protein